MQPSLPKTALRPTENQQLDRETHTKKPKPLVSVQLSYEKPNTNSSPKPDPFPCLEANPKQFLLEKPPDLVYHTRGPFPGPLYHTL